MQLEVGKYYKTRDGRKVGPLDFREDWGGFACETTGSVYCPDGSHGDACDTVRCCIDNRPYDDLIAEWTDEPAQPTLSAETIDHIAIDSLRHHYATEMEPLQKEAFRIVLRYYGVTL